MRANNKLGKKNIAFTQNRKQTGNYYLYRRVDFFFGASVFPLWIAINIEFMPITFGCVKVK